MNSRSIKCRMYCLVLATTVLLASACNESSITEAGSSANGQIAWQLQDQRVDVSNRSSATVRYAIIGRTWLHNALVDWCFGRPSCGESLSPSATVQRRYDTIDHSEPPETQVVILWWTPNGSAEVGFDSVVVRIR